MAEHNLVLFAISTCMRCSQAKAFLNRHHAKYDLIHVDLIAEAQRAAVMEKIMRYNPGLYFPALLVDDGHEIVIGFQQERYRKLTDSD